MKRKKIGIILPGGGTKVLFQELGVLKALEEFKLKPEVIVGYSGGALLGGYYCMGKSIKELLEIASQTNPLDYLNYSLRRFCLLNREKVAEAIKYHSNSARIEDLPIEFITTATNVKTGKKHSFKEGDLATAIMASSTMPLLFGTVKIDGSTFCDGVYSDPMPINDLKKANVDLIIVCRPHLSTEEEQSIYSLFVTAIMRRVLKCYKTVREIENLMDKKIEQHEPDIVIHLDCTNGPYLVSIIGFNNTENLVDIGYHQTIKQLKNHFKIPD